MRGIREEETERGLPANLAAERTLLGTFLTYPESLKRKETESLIPEDFSLTGHQKIYRCMLTLVDEGAPLDVMLPETLRQEGQLEAVGGIGYISELLEGSVDHPTLESYVKILKEKSNLRKIIEIGRRASETASECYDSSKVAERALSELGAILEASGETHPDILAPWNRFAEHGQEQVDWLVDGVIEVGTNGFILGPPKSRKSWAAEALAVSLVTGEPWFGQKTRHRRVALVSREDHAGTTSRRIKQLMRGKDVDPAAPWIDDSFWLNSRAEARLLLLTDSKALRSLISNLKDRRVEFLILDVLGVLHEGDENEVKEMRAVLRCVERLAGEVGCQVCIVHHARKGCEWGDTLSNWARGSSVIAGFAEFLMGCMVENEEQGIIHTKFDCKGDKAPSPFYWKIDSYPERKALELNRVDYQKSEGRTASRMK